MSTRALSSYCFVSLALCWQLLLPVMSVADVQLTLSIQDADTGKPIPARVYLESSSGEAFYFTSKDSGGTAIRYEKQNWVNKDSTEYHTTVSAHPCVVSIPAGEYRLTVERGKEYVPHVEELTISENTNKTISIQRWVNMAERGWYSGDLHIHRTIEELRNILPAEDLNVAFPLTQWVTVSDTLPSAGDKNQQGKLPDSLVKLDEEHVIWPLSTEYEIFQVNKQRHTLGALFVIGHKKPLERTVPPWEPVVESALASDPNVLFDMDKLAWPFAMTLPVITPNATYELSNNHVWRTEFAFRDWYTPCPEYMTPPFGTTAGGEREWINFTLGMYYTLLNCGFRLPPSAGTANGVHPVPAGFSRVYVHQPNGFDYEDWVQGLHEGRSFVTTGPMLIATAEGHDSGHEFSMAANELKEIPLHMEILSEQPLSYGEVVVNGRPDHLLRPTSQQPQNGAYHTVIDFSLTPDRSGWFAVRFWEERPGHRIRFAHTAPWYVTVDGKPVQPTHAEKDYVVGRMEAELTRSEGIVSAAGMAEYRQALEHYQSLVPYDDSVEIAKAARPFEDGASRENWLQNMADHRFNAYEVREATGLPLEDAGQALAEYTVDQAKTADRLKILPYPGGRHPRIGFLDGAIDPQRETKVSIFPPWEDGGYVVVDVPEAIFSNLGLTYLAHTHIPTIWDDKGITLESEEWKVTDAGLVSQRTLPNGISFTSHVTPDETGALMNIELANRTNEKLTGMRVQVCTMLKGALGFNLQQSLETVTQDQFIAVKAARSDRWIITAWTPLKRVWSNPPVPCFHSDPVFPDCEPNQTVRVYGGLWFYEGQDVQAEIKRLAGDVFKD